MAYVKDYHLPSGHLEVAILAFAIITHPHFLHIGLLKCLQALQVSSLRRSICWVAIGIPALAQAPRELAKPLAFWQAEQLTTTRQ